MMTKKEMAEAMLKQKRKELNIPDEMSLEDVARNYMYESSTVAVCLDVLGVLDNTPAMKQYAASRGGLLYIGKAMSKEYGDLPMLSVRELIDLLPDTREPN